MRLACAGLPSWFEKNAAIVTPSRLLAGVASQQFTRYQLDRGIESWQRPAIYGVDAWLSANWQEARYGGHGIGALLSHSQEHLVWQDIIEQEEPALFDPASTARLAIGAARLLAEWQIPAGGDLWADHQDAQHFLRWYGRFRRKCRDEGWLAHSDLWHLVPGWIDRGLCEPKLTVFAAFEVIPPALQTIANRLAGLAKFEPGVRANPPGSVAIQSCLSFAEEIERAARWARAHLEQDRRASLGVFVPDLMAHRSLVERIFEQVFYPAAALHLVQPQNEANGDSPEYSAFHLNAVHPVKEHPLIANALLLLQLALPRIPMADACSILRSPYIIGASAERGARALADLQLRRRRDIEVSLRDIECSAVNCPRLSSVWAELKRITSGPKYRHLSDWSKFISDVLEALGWPGDADLTFEEREHAELWNRAVSTLSSLGLVSKPLSFEEALARLRTVLQSEGRQRGDWTSPVQILDAFDAAGVMFDSAWLVGLSAEAWRPAIHSSALVPLSVQGAHGVPGSTRQSVQALQQRMTASLRQVAPSVHGTFSGRLSPLVPMCADHEVATLPAWRGKVPAEAYSPSTLEEIDDSWGPPCDKDEPIRGGTGIVKSQSLCPFRAFAEYRLRSNVPEEACFGFDSRDRGQFLHKALQTVWDQLKTQDRLRLIEPDDLRRLVQDAVLEAVRDDASSPFHELTTLAERARLEKLILQWLEIERQRTQPFTVASVEQKRSYDISGLRLDLRVDRMDRLKNGSVVLIDYKSGKQTAPKLEGQRPAEPQLLVYAAAVQETVDGVFFGQLKPRELRAVGFGRERHFPGRSATVKKDWDAFLEESVSNVERIALGFSRGDAVVDPIRGACDYCSQKPFCRIREQTDLAGEGENDPE